MRQPDARPKVGTVALARQFRPGSYEENRLDADALADPALDEEDFLSAEDRIGLPAEVGDEQSVGLSPAVHEAVGAEDGVETVVALGRPRRAQAGPQKVRVDAEFLEGSRRQSRYVQVRPLRVEPRRK